MVKQKKINLNNIEISYDGIVNTKKLKGKISTSLKKSELKQIEELEIIKELYKSSNDYELLVKKIKKAKPSKVVLFGMGGSSLGTKSILKALARKQKKLLVVNNVDGETFEDLFKEIKINSTFFIFVSKSGNTIEIKNLLKETLKKFDKSRISFTKRMLILTDKLDSFLNRFAKKNKVPIFYLNENIGGRYSALSPSTMIPCELANISSKQLLIGARNMYEELKALEFQPISDLTNFYYQNYLSGKDTTILMLYKDFLDSFGEWFMQLWGESLGKKNIGLTPITYLGPRDQHSQLQLVLDGPKNKTVTFISVSKTAFGNKRLDALSQIEMNATLSACRKRKIPVTSFKMKDLTPESISSMIIILEITTILLAKKLNINPFNQPSVELIKKNIGD
ncbi:MAG: hypothetical protein VX343_04680 [Thermodesulfobacteriota bacterium]|nr:hypothetical protein [Thermodesulfobacteriota bacterium]|tara:strand:+ start:1953 stop:3134 length:1182 start_codon:yes stop_codon:yes gene_type:complete